MDYLARSISITKWMERDYTSDGEVGADAFACLRTQDDCLSLWLCDADDEVTIKEVILALAANNHRAETLQLVVLPREVVEGEGLRLEPSEGRTPVEDLRDRHVDAVELTGSDLVTFARLVAETLRGEELDSRYHRFTKSQVVAIVQAAVDAQRVAKSGLEARLQDDLS